VKTRLYDGENAKRYDITMMIMHESNDAFS